MVRTPCWDKTGLKKGTWTSEEDRKLIAYVTKYGCWNWRQLPKYAGLARCGKSCRLRWVNYLKPNIKRGNYTKEEEDKIIRLHKSLGNRWSAIAAQLPGRTDNEIKNHWHTSLRKRLEQNSFTKNGAKKTPKHLLVHNTETKKDERESKANVNGQEQELKLPDTASILENPISSMSMTTDITSVGRSTELGNNEVHHSQPFAESNGDFWTEPFLADNFYDLYISNDLQAPLPDPGYASFHSPFLVLDEEIILWP